MPRFYRKKKYARRPYRTYKRRSYGRRWRSRGRSYAWGNRTARKVGALYKAVKMRAVYRPSRYVAVKRRYSKSRVPYGRSYTKLSSSRQKAIVSREARAALKKAGFNPQVAAAAVAAAVADVDMGKCGGDDDAELSAYSIGGKRQHLDADYASRFITGSPLLRFD